MPIVKDIPDKRAAIDIGCAIFVKRAGESKYHLWLPVSNIPATGSAPEQIETTVTTARKKTYISGRQDSPQMEATFNAHRDNFKVLNGDMNKQLDFLLVNSDGTGFKFSGYVSYYQDEISVGNALTGKAVITVSSSEEKARLNVLDLIEDTVTYTAVVPEFVEVTGTGTTTFKVETDPLDATVAVASETTSVATATVSSGTVTITGVTAGSTIVTLTATKTGFANGITTVLVNVK